MKFVKLFFYFLLLMIVLGFAYWLWPERKIPAGTIAERLVVHKSERKMELWSNNKMTKTYQISLGGNPQGHKKLQGDGKTPEGLYYIDGKNPNSRFHLNLGISYPNKEDRLNAENPGGDIKIHGLKNENGFIGKFHRFFDGTDGCIAVTNIEIEELYEAVPIGTPIEIKQ